MAPDKHTLFSRVQSHNQFSVFDSIWRYDYCSSYIRISLVSCIFERFPNSLKKFRNTVDDFCVEMRWLKLLKLGSGTGLLFVHSRIWPGHLPESHSYPPDLPHGDSCPACSLVFHHHVPALDFIPFKDMDHQNARGRRLRNLNH